MNPIQISPLSLTNMKLPDHPLLVVAVLVVLAFFPSPILSQVGNELETCGSQFFSCGDAVRDLSFPFYGDGRPEFCGHPGFGLRCINSETFIIIDEIQLRVLNVSENSSTITLARNELWDADLCSPKTQRRLELNNGSGFHFAPTVEYLNLIYDCPDEGFSLSVPYKFPCDEKDNRSFFYLNDSVFDLVNTSGQLGVCRNSVIKVPVSQSGLAEVESQGGDEDDILDVLKRGFDLKYGPFPYCEHCRSSGGRCGNNATYSFLCFCSGRTELVSCEGEKTNWKLKIIIGTVAALVGVILMSVVSFIYIRRYRKRHARPYYFSRKISSEKYQGKDVENGSTILGVRVFTHEELVIATNEFDVSKELGDGGYGTVYYGKLKDGRSVAVKRLYENNYKRVEQFVNEIEILAKMRHPNLVSLYGCTSQHCHELLLVYEFVSNGTVADHLYGGRGPPTELPWPTRLHIAVGTASALTYLHANGIIHRDVKTNNILLDETFTVKVADFGLSRLFPTHVTHVSTAPQGTPGYVDPDYHLCYQLTSKSDVFSFGVVLMELVSSLPAVDITRHRHDINLSTMAVNRIQNHALGELVDRRLGFETDATVRRSITAVAELAFQCLQQEKDLRPCMETVLSELKAIQSRDYGVGKAEKNTDTAKDDAVLLKNGSATLSPDTVTVSWHSRDTTPNAST